MKKFCFSLSDADTTMSSGTSTSTPREAGLPGPPTSPNRTASSSSHASPPLPLATSQTSRKGIELDPPSDEPDDASQFMDETMEMMDNVVLYTDGVDDEGPCTSATIVRENASRAARQSWNRSERAMSTESERSDHSSIDSPKRKTYYTFRDAVTNKAVEKFRTDILNNIRTGDYEYMPFPADGTSLLLTDKWRDEWSGGVQVPLHPNNLPQCETQDCDIPSHSSGPWNLPHGKYLLSTPAPYMKEDTHVLHEPPPLRIYQGDRLDELWLERRNSKYPNSLPLDLSTMLDLMNEFEIECFKTMHRIVLSSLSSEDMVDEDAPCDVCHITEDAEDDPMIFCDSCNICLHLSCYGLTEVPDGHWECDMCRAVGFARHDRLKCELCPNSGGAMKEVEGGDKWVHVSCAMWIPEIALMRTKSGREVVVGLDRIPDRRRQLKCSICDIRQGACIQCEYRSCAVAFHTTCAQRSGVCDVLDKINEAECMHYYAYCKRHTLEMKSGGGASGGRMKSTNNASGGDKMDGERSEMLKGLESSFFLHVKYEDAAKKLSVPPVQASDVYEFWKLKREKNGGRPLIPTDEITVDTARPMVTMESQDADGEAYVMLRASDDVQHHLTPFQLKCWRFQKHVAQTADRGRTGCDMILKRERRKLDVVNTSRDLFLQLVHLDSQPGIPLSSRVLTQIADGLQAEFTPEEILESDRIAEEMAQWRPKKEEDKEGDEGGKKREEKKGDGGGRKRSLTVGPTASARLARPSSTKKDIGVRSRSVGRVLKTGGKAGEEGGESSKRKRSISTRRTIALDLSPPPAPSPPSSTSSSHSKMATRSRV